MIKRKMNIKVKKSTEVMAKLSLGNAMNILRQTKVNRNLNIGKVLDIGTVINASEDLSALCSLPNARFKVLMSIFIKAIAKNSPYSYNPTEGKKYTGLLTFEQKVYQDIKATKDINNINNKELKEEVSTKLRTVIMDEEIQYWILKDTLTCDLNNVSNLRKIAEDINTIYRLLGERTIDAFKKFYSIVYIFIQEDLRAKSVLHFNDNVDYINYSKLGTKDYEFEITYKNRFANEEDINGKVLNKEELELGSYLTYESTSLYDSDRKFINFYQDAISEVRESISFSLEAFFNEDVPALLKDTNIERAGLNYISKVYFANMRKQFSSRYGLIVSQKIAALNEISIKADMDGDMDSYIAEKDRIISNYNEAIKELADEFRTFVEFSGISNEDAGAIMYAISNFNLDDNNKYVVQNNQCFLNVAPEYFVSYYAHRFNKTKAYSKLIGDVDNINNYIRNDGTVEVRNSYVVGSDLTIQCDCNYSGIATVEYVWDKAYKVKEPYIVVNMDYVLFNDIDRTNKPVRVTCYKTGFIDLDTTKSNSRTVTYKENPTRIFNILIADPEVTFEFMPIYRYSKVIEGKARVTTLKSVMVAHRNGNTIPVAYFSCSCNELQALYAGLTVSTKNITVKEDNISVVISFDIKDTVRNENVNLYNYEVSISKNERMIAENANDINNLTPEAKDNPFAKVEDTDEENNMFNIEEDATLNEDTNEEDFTEDEFKDLEDEILESDSDIGFDISDLLD